MATVIHSENLTKRFGEKLANDHINLDIRARDIYGLVGRNGSGKTTLIKQLMGSLKPTYGEIKLFDTSALDQARRRIGFASDTNFFAHLSGYENLYYQASIKGVKDRSRIDSLMKHWDLDPKDTKQYRKYSTGMKQKLALSAAMLSEPELLVLDEPINGLDPESIRHFRQTMLKLQETSGTTIFVSSHILSELAMMCTRFGILEKGQLIEELTQAELHTKAQSAIYLRTTDHEATRRFFDSSNIPYEPVNDAFRLQLEMFEPGELSYMLTAEGIHIVELRNEEHSLEDYYISLIGGEDA